MFSYNLSCLGALEFYCRPCATLTRAPSSFAAGSTGIYLKNSLIESGTNILLSGSANANDALTISLVAADSSGSKTLSSFHPKFTYPIFGDDESIFGYQ